MGDQTVSMSEARTLLSRLIRRVEAGEEIVITRSGRKVARLVPFQHSGPREPGLWRGRVRISHDFDQTDEGILNAIELEDPWNSPMS